MERCLNAPNRLRCKRQLSACTSRDAGPSSGMGLCRRVEDHSWISVMTSRSARLYEGKGVYGGRRRCWQRCWRQSDDACAVSVRMARRKSRALDLAPALFVNLREALACLRSFIISMFHPDPLFIFVSTRSRLSVCSSRIEHENCVERELTPETARLPCAPRRLYSAHLGLFADRWKIWSLQHLH